MAMSAFNTVLKYGADSPSTAITIKDTPVIMAKRSSLETTTQDKRNIILQSYVVWKIADPVAYHKSVGSQGTVNTYINDQVFSATNSSRGQRTTSSSSDRLTS